MTRPNWFQQIEHPITQGILVEAPGVPALFERAAWGLFATLTDPDQVRYLEEHRIEITAESRELLLLKWLNELNYRHRTDGILYSAFEVKIHDDRRLLGKARGERLDPERHVLQARIEVVLHEELAISPTGGGWQARVTFEM